MNRAFLETIRVEDGRAFHLDYHQKRLEQTLKANRIDVAYDLASLVLPPDAALYRCRVIYTAERLEVSFHPYHPRMIRTLQAVCDDTIDYPFKYAERHALDALFAQRGACDDVVIVKNGLLSDTTIANIALFDGEEWVTPASPLLHGTTRARLLDEGLLTEKEITPDSLSNYCKVAVMNAMIGLVEVENGIIFPN